MAENARLLVLTQRSSLSLWSKIPRSGREGGVRGRRTSPTQPLRTWLAELARRITVAEGDIHQPNHIEYIRIGVAIDVGSGVRALHEVVRERWIVAEGNINRFDNIKNIHIPVTPRIGQAGTETVRSRGTVTVIVAMHAVRIREREECLRYR